MQGMSVRNGKIRKVKYRPIQPNTIPPGQLKRIKGVRNIEDRNQGQYTLIENGQMQNFQYFNQIRFHNNLALRGKQKLITLVRSDQVDPWDKNC